MQRLRDEADLMTFRHYKDEEETRKSLQEGAESKTQLAWLPQQAVACSFLGGWMQTFCLLFNTFPTSY